MSWPLLPPMKVASFWIVVMMILSARVFELPLEYRGRGVRVGRTLLEPVVLPHGLVVEVFAVDDEQHLVDVRQSDWRAGLP